MFREQVIVNSRFLFLLLVIIGMGSCIKEEEYTHEARLRAPVRSYSVTSRIDNKEANNDSKASGILKGSYDESTREFSFSISYEGTAAQAIHIKKGARGSAGTLIWNVPGNNGKLYNVPVTGKKVLTALQERDLLKGTWFITIDSDTRSPEIRGIITLKQK